MPFTTFERIAYAAEVAQGIAERALPTAPVSIIEETALSLLSQKRWCAIIAREVAHFEALVDDPDVWEQLEPR